MGFYSQSVSQATIHVHSHSRDQFRQIPSHQAKLAALHKTDARKTPKLVTQYPHCEVTTRNRTLVPHPEQVVLLSNPLHEDEWNASKVSHLCSQLNFGGVLKQQLTHFTFHDEEMGKICRMHQQVDEVQSILAQNVGA